MYVCICNPFTDNDVEDHLDTLGDVTRIKDVYHACSGGESMNCGSCACELKKMVDQHNSEIAVGKMTVEIEKIIHKTKETV